MDAFLWDTINIRSGFMGDFGLSSRVAVGVDDDSAKLHGWAQLTAQGRKVLSSEDIPDGLQALIYKYCKVEIIVSTQTLDNEWLQSTNNTGRFDVAVREERDWKTLQKLPFEKKLIHITEITGMGTVLGLASGKGKLHIVPLRWGHIHFASSTCPVGPLKAQSVVSSKNTTLTSVGSNVRSGFTAATLQSVSQRTFIAPRLLYSFLAGAIRASTEVNQSP
jgi:hypothetical protein